MPDPAYPMFCPVAAAADMIEPRWSLLVLSELWAGSTRFAEIQRGVPGMSPGLLSRRLREMVEKGLVERVPAGAAGRLEYHTTPLADELEPIVRKLGEWAHRNIAPEVSLRCLDAWTLMWNIRRKIDRAELPGPRCVIQFTLRNLPDAPADYWLVIRPGFEPDLCRIDPKAAVDLFVTAQLRALTSAWMGHTSFEHEIAGERIALVGDATLARGLTRWLVRSCYASCDRRAAPALSRRSAPASDPPAPSPPP